MTQSPDLNLTSVIGLNDSRFYTKSSQLDASSLMPELFSNGGHSCFALALAVVLGFGFFELGY